MKEKAKCEEVESEDEQNDDIEAGADGSKKLAVNKKIKSQS